MNHELLKFRHNLVSRNWFACQLIDILNEDIVFCIRRVLYEIERIRKFNAPDPSSIAYDIRTLLYETRINRKLDIPTNHKSLYIINENGIVFSIISKHDNYINLPLSGLDVKTKIATKNNIPICIQYYYHLRELSAQQHAFIQLNVNFEQSGCSILDIVNIQDIITTGDKMEQNIFTLYTIKNNPTFMIK